MSQHVQTRLICYGFLLVVFIGVVALAFYSKLTVTVAIVFAHLISAVAPRRRTPGVFGVLVNRISRNADP